MTYKIQKDISLLEKRIKNRENHSFFSPTDRQINKLIQQIAEHRNLLSTDSTSAIQISSLIQRTHQILDKTTLPRHIFKARFFGTGTLSADKLSPLAQLEEELLSKSTILNMLEGTPLPSLNEKYLNDILEKYKTDPIITRKAIEIFLNERIANLLKSIDNSSNEKTILCFLNNILSNIKNANKETSCNLLTLAICLENASLPEIKIVNALKKIKDISKEKLEKLSNIVEHLKTAELKSYQITDILPSLQDMPGENVIELFNMLAHLNREQLPEDTAVNLVIELQDAPKKKLEELSAITTHLKGSGITGQTLTNILTELKNTPTDGIKELSTMMVHLNNAGISGRITATIATKVKDSPRETIIQLSTIGIDLKNYRLDDYQIATVLVTLKDTPSDQLLSLSTLLKELKSLGVEKHSTSDLLLELKDTPNDKLKNLLNIAKILHTQKLKKDALPTILLDLRTIPNDELSTLSAILKSLKNKGMDATHQELQSLKLADKKNLYENLLLLTDNYFSMPDNFTNDIILLAYSLEGQVSKTNEFAYDLLKSKFQVIDITRVTLLPNTCKIKLIRQLLFDISHPTSKVLEFAKTILKSIPDLNAEEFIKSLLDEIQNLSVITQDDLNNILSDDSLKNFKKNFRLLTDSKSGVDAAYHNYKSEFLQEKHNYLGINKPNTFSNRYNTQTIPGLAIMATRVMQKNNFKGLFVCANHQAIANKLNEINKDPKDQRCALIISHDAFGDEVPNHKISICIEKKDGFLHVFFLDSLGVHSTTFYNKIEKMLQQLNNQNYQLTSCNFSREKGVYGCEIFALQDSKSFLQDSDFIHKIVIKNQKGKFVIVALPPPFMLPTQDIPLLRSYVKDRPSRADITFPETKKTLRTSASKHMSKKTGTIRNEYISRKTIKHMHFITSCLKTLPKEQIQAITKQSLLT